MEAKKSLGQHFLRDATVARRIVEQLKGATSIVEIGGGKGALTRWLVELGVPVRVVEIDRKLAEFLKRHFAEKGVEVFCADATSFVLPHKCSVVGNLPYNVAKRIIANMAKQRQNIEKMVFMVQKEVANTIVAQPGTPDYTRFSVFVQLYFKVNRLFDVPAGAFVPKPKVVSSVVSFYPYETSCLGIEPDEGFFKYLSSLFAHPRKKVRNNLKGLISGDCSSGFLDKRPGELTIEDIYRLYKECIDE